MGVLKGSLGRSVRFRFDLKDVILHLAAIFADLASANFLLASCNSCFNFNASSSFERDSCFACFPAYFIRNRIVCSNLLQLIQLFPQPIGLFFVKRMPIQVNLKHFLVLCY